MSGPDSCHVGQLSERAYLGCQQRAQMGDVGGLVCPLEEGGHCMEGAGEGL
jgi:hypothetical protein